MERKSRFQRGPPGPPIKETTIPRANSPLKRATTPPKRQSPSLIEEMTKQTINDIKNLQDDKREVDRRKLFKDRLANNRDRNRVIRDAEIVQEDLKELSYEIEREKPSFRRATSPVLSRREIERNAKYEKEEEDRQSSIFDEESTRRSSPKYQARPSSPPRSQRLSPTGRPSPKRTPKGFVSPVSALDNTFIRNPKTGNVRARLLKLI